MHAAWLLVAGFVHAQVFQGSVTAEGGDYLLLPFDVPADAVEFRVEHADDGEENILDFGLWAPDGFRGWGGGLTEPMVVGSDESSRGYLPGPLTPGTWNVVVGKALIRRSPANYTVRITQEEVPTLPVRTRAFGEPPVLRMERRWYKGDFHVHSSESGDAQASFADIAALARSRGLSFVALTDHNTVSQHALVAAHQPQEPDVLFIRGAEVTTYGGHANASGIWRYVDHRVGLNGRTAADMVADVHAQGGLFSINHPTLDLGSACIGCAWTHADTPWDQVDALELHTSNHQPSVQLFTPAALVLWDAQHNAGHRITGVGGSDDHRAGQADSTVGSPTTVVRAEALSEAAVLAGVKEGRVMLMLRGPQDPLPEFTAEDALGSAPAAEVGDTVRTHRARLRFQVPGGEGMVAVLWRNGEAVWSSEVTGAEQSVAFDTRPQGDRWRLHLMAADLDAVITNHIYVEDAPVPPNSDIRVGPCACANTLRGRETHHAAGWVLMCALWVARRAVGFGCPRRRRSDPRKACGL